MSQTTDKVNPNDKKIKIDWFNLKKIVIDTIREDQFLYISSQVWLQVQFLIAIVFFSQFSDLFLLGLPFYFILSPSSPLYPPRGH